MSRPRAGIDLDGVVHQWSPTARALLDQRFGLKLSESESWDFIKDHTTPEQWKWLWSEGIGWGLFRGRPYPLAILALRRLYETHDIVIITARPEVAIPDTYGWLSDHRIMAREVHVMTNGEPKAAIPCDWYVDDHLVNVAEYAAAGKCVYLFDQPWNRHENVLGATRVYGWGDLLFKATSRT